MIPKIIHYCWFGGNPIPEKDRKCIESWKKFCPDYEIKEWNESNYEVTKNEYMYQAYQAKKWGFVPDYARLDIIYNNGGIYLDTDVEVVKNLDDLLDNKGIMCFETEYHVNPGCFVAGEKGNKTIKYLIDTIYSNRKYILDDGTCDLTPSPIMNTEALVNKGLIANGTKQAVEDITVYSSEYFSPVNYNTGKLNRTNNTYSIHWFNSSWFTKNQLRVRDIERKFYSDNKLVYSFGRFLSFPFRIAAKYETKGLDGVIETTKKRFKKSISN